MILPYIGCFTRRSTFTITVLSPLSETTVPVSTRFGIFFPLRLGRSGGALGLECLDLRDRAAKLAHPRRLLELVGRRLAAEVELLALERTQLGRELVVGHRCQVCDLGHCTNPQMIDSPRRATTLVLIGSFSIARSKATRASGPGTPSSSNRMRPGLTRATQYSGAPLPEPMRTSAGFDDTGTSG